MTDELVHYGVKGMRWGVRKNDEGSYPSPAVIEPGLHKKTHEAAQKVTGLIADRYGFEVKHVKVLDKSNPDFDPHVAAHVIIDTNTKDNERTIFVQPHDLTKQLKQMHRAGWMVPGTANHIGLLTHESGHAMLHASQHVVSDGKGGHKVLGDKVKALDKALDAALKAADEDGRNILGISGYANAAGVRHELEAELFSQYHWAERPPRLVKVWGETLHRELGIDPTPFKEVTNRG
jgi:hypothetical protein